MDQPKKMLKSWFGNNLSYKLVALVIALILWLTILGRRDFVLTKEVPVDFITTSSYSVVSQSAKQISVKVSGPRQALKRFAETPGAQTVTINLAGRGSGRFEVNIPIERLDLPFGVKLISVRPKQIQVEVAPSRENEDKNENKDEG